MILATLLLLSSLAAGLHFHLILDSSDGGDDDLDLCGAGVTPPWKRAKGTGNPAKGHSGPHRHCDQEILVKQQDVLTVVDMSVAHQAAPSVAPLAAEADRNSTEPLGVWAYAMEMSFCTV
jgi:hypothetical protein